MRALSMAALFALLAAASSARAARVGRDPPPPFCRGLDCPRFSAINTTAGLEVRLYEASTYAGVSVAREETYARAYVKALKLLQAYFDGANGDGAELDRTTPLVISLPLDRESDDPWEFYSYLPHAYQKTPPLPDSKHVRIARFKERLIAVKDFTGFATETTVLEERRKAIKAVDGLLAVAPAKNAFAAEYNSPAQITERLNELWLILGAEVTDAHEQGEDIFPGRIVKRGDVDRAGATDAPRERDAGIHRGADALHPVATPAADPSTSSAVLHVRPRLSIRAFGPFGTDVVSRPAAGASDDLFAALTGVRDAARAAMRARFGAGAEESREAGKGGSNPTALSGAALLGGVFRAAVM